MAIEYAAYMKAGRGLKFFFFFMETEMDTNHYATALKFYVYKVWWSKALPYLAISSLKK